MLLSLESTAIFACTFFSNLTFPFSTLKIQSQKNLIIPSEQFKMKHLFSVTGKSIHKSII